ncbi:MAG: haloalkane dehalogenase [Firmicutes bacterium ADurb.BinA205]|nr:MAG: haloalkane dehalogenase [Firmicutes bacterium ADurb.BinA205]
MSYENIVKVGDASLNVYSEGSGSTTIVFMADLGITSPVLEYRPLYTKLAERYRVVVIEKSGYGYSGHMISKRTIENLVMEDRYSLKAAGIEPPYVLAVHGYGGIEAVYWATQYPDEVKGILGIDMGMPDHALAVAKELSEMKRQEMVRKRRDFLIKVAKKGLMSKLLYKQTLDVSGLMSGGYLTAEEKAQYKELYYKNLLNEEVSDESVLMTENATKAHDSGKVQCPMCLFISDMNGQMKSISWRELSVSFAKRANAEYHLSDTGHYPYSKIPGMMADTFMTFIEKNCK